MCIKQAQISGPNNGRRTGGERADYFTTTTDGHTKQITTAIDAPVLRPFSARYSGPKITADLRREFMEF